ncbi:Organic cation transporter protein, partial [Pseudolycoriella hygida]
MAIEMESDEPDDVKHASDIYGEWGPLQRNVTIFFVMIYIVASFQNMGVIFYLSPIDYHCRLPEEYQDRNVSKCYLYEGSTVKCTEWQFDYSFYQKTLIDEFELVCDREHFISMTKSIFQIGYLVSSIFTGLMSDRYGRLFAFKFSIILELLASLSQALSVNIYHFLISRLFLGIGSYGRFSTGMLLLFELVGPSYRASISIACEIGWSLSVLLLPIANYFIPHFRYMQLIVFGYELIFLIWLWRLPESPRWLITHDKFDEAAELITKTAKSLNKLSDVEIERKLAKLRSYLDKEQEKLQLEAKKTIIDLWRQPILFRYCILLYTISFCLSFTAYGFSYNAAAYGGSLHVTMFVQALSTSSVLCTVYLAVDRFNRKSLALFLSVCAACSIWTMVAFTFDKNHLNHLTTMMFVSKFFCGGFFLLIHLIKSEIFPTTLRQISLGSCSVAMRFGSVIAPYSRELAGWTHLSLLIGLYGICAIVNSVCIYFLPETSKGEIPDTIEEAIERCSINKKKASGKKSAEVELANVIKT